MQGVNFAACYTCHAREKFRRQDTLASILRTCSLTSLCPHAQIQQEVLGHTACPPYPCDLCTQLTDHCDVMQEIQPATRLWTAARHR